MGHRSRTLLIMAFVVAAMTLGYVIGYDTPRGVCHAVEEDAPIADCGFHRDADGAGGWYQR